MARARGFVTIDRNRCKECCLCVEVCPLHLIVLEKEINPKGYHPAGAPDPERCTACALCALMCPETCIRVAREEREKP